MKIFYKIDNEVNRNCLIDCPFNDIKINGISGKKCKLGSIACQECEYCYGHHDGLLIGVPIDSSIKFEHERYIKLWFYNNRTKKLKKENEIVKILTIAKCISLCYNNYNG